MKTKKYSQKIILAFIALALLIFNSCKKDKDETVSPVTESNGTLFFHFHTNVDTSEVEGYGDTCVLSDNRNITVSKAQLYISGIQLVKLDGSTIDVSGVIQLIKQEEEAYTIGGVPAGNYKSVKFNVGLSPSTNASIPAVDDSTLNQPSMWFDSSAQPSGFVFVNFQGTIDTATTPSSSNTLYPFNYKIGTNVNFKTVTMPDENFTVTPNQAQYVHMLIDYSRLFMGVQLNSNLDVSTTLANATALGTQISNNIAGMFSYDE